MPQRRSKLISALQRKELKTPLRPRGLDTIWADDTPSDFKMRFYEERFQPELRARLDLLATELGLQSDDTDRWQSLALLLAREFIPGFQIVDPDERKAAGRPKNLTFEMQVEFVKRLERLTQSGVTKKDALRQLARDKIIRNKKGKSLAEDALRAEANRLKKSRIYQFVLDKL